MSRFLLAFACSAVFLLCGESGTRTCEAAAAMAREFPGEGFEQVAAPLPPGLEGPELQAPAVAKHARKVWMGPVAMHLVWVPEAPPSRKERHAENAPASGFVHKEAGRGPPVR